MKTYLLLLASALALTACGDDEKPKKKNIENQQVTPKASVEQAATPEPQQAEAAPPAPAQDLSPTEPTPVAMPTDEQSGYKEYIEMPAQQAVGTAVFEPQVINTSREITAPSLEAAPATTTTSTSGSEQVPEHHTMVEVVSEGGQVRKEIVPNELLDFR